MRNKPNLNKTFPTPSPRAPHHPWVVLGMGNGGCYKSHTAPACCSCPHTFPLLCQDSSPWTTDPLEKPCSCLGPSHGLQGNLLLSLLHWQSKKKKNIYREKILFYFKTKSLWEQTADHFTFLIQIKSKRTKAFGQDVLLAFVMSQKHSEGLSPVNHLHPWSTSSHPTSSSVSIFQAEHTVCLQVTALEKGEGKKSFKAGIATFPTVSAKANCFNLQICCKENLFVRISAKITRLAMPFRKKNILSLG